MPSTAQTPKIRLTPPVLATTRLPLVQTIELSEDNKVIGTATWFTTGTDGLIQLLDITVDESVRRRGVGTRVFELVRKEASQFFRSRGGKLRRITANTEQKSHIVARSFLTSLGFHHVQTITNTLKNQDVLVYLLGCD